MMRWSITRQGANAVIQVVLPLATAQTIATQLPGIIAAFESSQINEASQRLTDTGEDPRYEAQKAKWAELAQHAAKEIAALPTDQRLAYMRRFAADNDITVEFLRFILSQHRRAVREKHMQRQISKAHRLRRSGKTSAEIAEALGVTDRQVRKYLTTYKTHTRERRRKLREVRRWFDNTQGGA